jgi:lysophospholipase L1-like esterase
MKKWLAGVLVVLFSLAIALIGVEWLLRLIDPYRFAPKSDSHFGKPVLYRLSRSPGLGYEFRPNAATEAKGIAYRINRFGFRDIEQRFRKKGKRVIIVGDSLTFGWDLPLEETYPFLTREALRSKGRPLEIWAMGVTGYNTVQEYHLIREQALRFDPDLILLQICMNDFEKSISIRTDREHQFRLTQYHEILIPYLFGKSKLSGWFMTHSFLFKFLNLKLTPLVRRVKRDFAIRDYYSMGTEAAVRHLKKTQELLSRTSCRFASVIFPFRRDSMSPPYLAFQSAVRGTFGDLGIPFLDLDDTLNPGGKEPRKFWVDSVHPNRAGNERVAEKLASFIASLAGNE